MKVVFSKFSRIGKTQGIEEVMEHMITSALPDINFESVTLHVSNDINPELDPEKFKEGDSVRHDQIVSEWRLDYPDPAQKEGIRRIRVENTQYLDYDSVISRYVAEVTCPKHEYVRDKHSSGSEYKDGRVVCLKCGYQLHDVMDSDPISQLARTSMSSEKDYPTVHDWRNPITGKVPMLQGGDSGLVFGKESYITAFFEAFPKIGGMGTFIRGEGASLKEAEDKAWMKYQRHSSCEKHEFSRTVNGTHRTDGSGTCTLCGFYSTDALPPETTCECCGTPTNNEHNEKHLCYKHFFESVTVDEYVEAYYEYLNDRKFKAHHFDDKNEIAAKHFFIYELKRWALYHFCDGDATLVESIERELDHLARYISRVYDYRFITPTMGDEDNYPDYLTIIKPHQLPWFEKVKSSGILNEIIKGYMNPNDDESATIDKSMFDQFS